MQARELMTESPVCCTPEQQVQSVAVMMVEHDCGCIPVRDRDSGRVIGVVTDRDIATRAVGAGLGPETVVGEVMTSDPDCCGPDSDVQDVERVMSERRVRRVPIVDERGRPVGIVAQADLARAAQGKKKGISDKDVARVVESVSAPTHGHAQPVAVQA